jgi:putative PIN family toxin of toxin-antitoxin system
VLHVVIDTNVLVSTIILPGSRVGSLLVYLRRGAYTPLYHVETLEELINVLKRPRIQTKYHISDDDIRTIIDLILLRGRLIEQIERIAVCRDPNDDIFLSLAVAGRADAIVTGDSDLLSLTPFRSIPILTPTQFLARLASVG